MKQYPENVAPPPLGKLVVRFTRLSGYSSAQVTQNSARSFAGKCAIADFVRIDNLITAREARFSLSLFLLAPALGVSKCMFPALRVTMSFRNN